MTRQDAINHTKFYGKHVAIGETPADGWDW